MLLYYVEVSYFTADEVTTEMLGPLCFSVWTRECPTMTWITGVFILNFGIHITSGDIYLFYLLIY